MPLGGSGGMPPPPPPPPGNFGFFVLWDCLWCNLIGGKLVSSLSMICHFPKLKRHMASKLDSLVSVQICCEMSLFRRFFTITLYSYKKLVMSYTKVHSVCAWSNSEIGYSSCSLIGNNYELKCTYVKYGLSQFHYCWPLIFPFRRYTDAF